MTCGSLSVLTARLNLDKADENSNRRTLARCAVIFKLKSLEKSDV